MLFGGDGGAVAVDIFFPAALRLPVLESLAECELARSDLAIFGLPRSCGQLKPPLRVQSRRQLSALRVADEHSWNDAAALKGYFARRGGTAIFDPRISFRLFIGQTTVDLALVEDGRLARPCDAIDRVRGLARSVDVLLFKPHPYEGALSHVAELAARVSNAAWTQDNVYALLSADNLRFACGLSSGALKEASFFLKPARYLINADRSNHSDCYGPVPTGFR